MNQKQAEELLTYSLADIKALLDNTKDELKDLEEYNKNELELISNKDIKFCTKDIGHKWHKLTGNKLVLQDYLSELATSAAQTIVLSYYHN